MGPVNATALAAFQHSFFWFVLTVLGFLLSVAYVWPVAMLRRTVEGSRERYLAATLVRGFGVPLAAYLLFLGVADVVQAHGFGAVSCLGSGLGVAWTVHTCRDDDFWSDASKRIRRALQSLRAGRWPSFAGSGA